MKTDYNVDTIPHPEYPRPQLKREDYTVLNGYWSFAKAKIGEEVSDFTDKILVPFSPEALNSGIPEGFTLSRDEKLVYQRSVELDGSYAQGVAYLHFGAVDQECNVFVNGNKVGYHKGGYTPFCMEIQDYLKNGENIIRVEVTDFTEGSHGARGKQSSNPGKIWYTPQSGIWQTVWMENVPKIHIKDLTVWTFYDKSCVEISVDCAGINKIFVYDGDREIIKDTFTGTINLEYPFVPWSPENPKLYTFTLKNEHGDRVESYFGMRSFGIGEDKYGKKRLMLNGKPYFMSGVLDQGYYSDGLLTPPSDIAMLDDIRLLKNMGFNMVRKHIKIEPMRWYYYCDLMGLIVWQDFVNGGGEYKFSHIGIMPFLGFKHKDSDYKYFSRENKSGREEFMQAMEETVRTLKNVTSIGVWVPFNEGWGQFDSFEITQRLLSLDNTRIIDSVSGWHDQGKDKTALCSLHTYYTPLRVPRDPRPVVLSEFGGYSMKIPHHVYSEKEFGYKIFKSEEELCHGLERLFLKKLLPLIGKGLSACVYTQLSDVEEEINGLITYDRAKIKIPLDFMKKLNSALYKEAEVIN
ncbi:MAG: glycoside hydrolase family 2 [Clostridia bacterium]|nr:glycoside hydrolase family 2 [Clostridia bacterium]